MDNNLNNLLSAAPSGAVQGPPPEAFADKLKRVANLVADASDADVFLYNGPIGEDADGQCIDACGGLTNRRTNAFVILTTYGGIPDTAYRIAKSFIRKYKKLVICIDGPCASAGTLIALGAYELVMTDHGALGPLDTQVAKSDELWVMSSGLTGVIALDELQDQSYKAFEESLVRLKLDLPNQLTLKTAMDTAVKLATGLFAPVYAQIDPMKLGEDRRALAIAEHYGRRLAKFSHENVKSRTIARLLADYPSHSFVIDREEARELFERVREPSAEEAALLELLGKNTRKPNDQPSVYLLSTTLPSDDAGDDDADERDGARDPETGVSSDERRDGSAIEAECDESDRPGEGQGATEPAVAEGAGPSNGSAQEQPVVGHNPTVDI